MENGDNLQGLRLGSVDDQVRVDRIELHWLVRQIPAPMTHAGPPRKVNDLLANDGFNPIGHLETGVLVDVPPNLDEIERGLRGKNLATPHSG